MVDPRPGDAGKRVSYTHAGPHSGAGETVYRGGKWTGVEHGTITSWNDHYVFVRFREDCCSKACLRESLSWGHATL